MPNEVEAHARIAAFQADCPLLSTLQLVRKYIIMGEPFAISGGMFDSLRMDVAEHFNVHPTDVYMVGSGKLGFSIAPRKRYSPFGDESDIDLAIVSKEIYEAIWKEVFKYDALVRSWPERERIRFALSHMKGWIRPDKLPVSNVFPRREEWWNFFESITSSNKYGPYKIRAGLFHSFDFLEAYHAETVQLCQNPI
ncbi:hypothetical protein [Hymenobacter ruber]